jgi:hypothetical protein
MIATIRVGQPVVPWVPACDPRRGREALPVAALPPC